MKIGWFSCGVTSAVACKIALNTWDDVELYYTDTGSQDADSFRFLQQCEEWYGRKINVVKNDKYADHFDCIRQNKMICNNHYYPCTYELKKQMRYAIEDSVKEWTGQIWGFDYSEVLRCKRMIEQYPQMRPLFPLVEKGLSKEDCAAIILQAGIQLPRMYRIGYQNNNCIGCPKGGMGYWNKIRVDFPEHFLNMAAIEQEIGHSCLKEHDGTPLFLSELDPNRGNFPTEIMPECSLFCQLEFMSE